MTCCAVAEEVEIVFRRDGKSKIRLRAWSDHHVRLGRSRQRIVGIEPYRELEHGRCVARGQRQYRDTVEGSAGGYRSSGAQQAACWLQPDDVIECGGNTARSCSVG